LRETRILIPVTIAALTPPGNNDLLAIDFQLQKVREKGPVVDAVETLIAQLRSLHGAIRTPRVANVDHSLDTFKWVSIGAKQILEESYPVAAHRTLFHHVIK
jgi:hypothetical protein